MRNYLGTAMPGQGRGKPEKTINLDIINRPLDWDLPINRGSTFERRQLNYSPRQLRQGYNNNNNNIYISIPLQTTKKEASLNIRKIFNQNF
jgi:hypothetical protein